MKMFHCIKQLEERVIATEVELMSWSDRMDLVALSNIKGEVSLHRLNWSRAWCLGPYKEGAKVKALSWKPDGKLIAIAYSTSHISVINVENKNIVNSLDVEGEVTCMIWAKEKYDIRNTKLTIVQDDQNTYMKYLDNSATFLPDPPALSNLGTFGTSDFDTTYTTHHKQADLNMLIIGTNHGIVYISIFGCSPLIIYDLKQKLGFPCSVINILLSEDLNLLYVTLKDQANVVKIAIIETEIFRSHTKEIYAICMKHEYLNSILSYLDNTISVIKETWEKILLEMDAKLSKFASKVPEGTLSVDFLDLLMFGTITDNMHEFLLQDLTKKGLEKFGQTIEMSYASIQKLLLRNVTKVGQNITYHLADLRGMARFKDRYEILGLQEDKITNVMLMNGAFLTKSGEMQLIINSSMVNYKAFFRWLYLAIVHLTEELIPPELPRMSQQDLAYITDFVMHFDDVAGTQEGSKKGFIMERLGQYLVDEPLSIPSGVENNEWNVFLSQNECVGRLPNVVNHCPNTSLIQQFNLLEKSVVECFEDLKDSLVKHFNVKTVLDVYEYQHKDFKITNMSFSGNKVLFAFLAEDSPSQGFYFLELTIEEEVFAKAGYIFVPQLILQDQPTLGDNFEILDIQFYSPNLLSLLLQENSAAKTGVICQISATAIRDKLLEAVITKEICKQELIRINTCTLGNSILRNTEGMVASKFAVSGCRKVSLVLAENRRKLRIYEMEAEEDEEDEIDVTNSTVKEGDFSMPDPEENSDVE